MCVRSFQTVATTFFVHVLATKKVGNIIFIGGIFIKNCGKDIIIGEIFMTSPNPTLFETHVLPCLAFTSHSLVLPAGNLPSCLG